MFKTLGDRMKNAYENRFKYMLPLRSYTGIRVDGKTFKTYTRGLERPFDAGLVEDMNKTAIYLCSNIIGAKIAYVQSDEITVLMTDFYDINTQAWYNNEVQKMVSVSASFATTAFNDARLQRFGYDENFKWAQFDSRVFQFSSREEAINNLIWRQQDATRNSLQSTGRAYYSHSELNNKSGADIHDLLMKININWNDYAVGYKRGRVVVKEDVTLPNGTVRKKWTVKEPPIFEKEKDFLRDYIPLP